MKKATILVAACALVALPAFAEQKVDQGSPVVLGSLDCAGATAGTCGDVLTGVVGNTPGGPLEYGCTTLDYDLCAETIYEICVGADDVLSVDMTYNHVSGATDLDLFLLGSCDATDCLDSSTGTSGLENVSANVTAGTYYVVVDGWTTGGVGRCVDGSHTVTVSCSSPCTPVSVDEQSWGSVKALHR
ncbi:MAG: hypothetical protein R3B81_10230 [bacterium]